MIRKRLAIIGAGPIGVEAAVLAAQKGLDVAVFDRGAVGAHLARWGHVQFFSPWKLNRSLWGEAALTQAGFLLADGEGFPTARQYLRTYLQPLLEVSGLGSRVRNLTTVHGVTRRDAWKGQLIGNRAEAGPFVLSVSGPEGAEYVEADVVFDASGVYGQPSDLGISGLPAIGEETVSDLIERWIPDPRDRDFVAYAGKHAIVVGDGYSASTSLHLLSQLREQHPGTRISWVLSPKDPPYTVLADDPLPRRKTLAEFGNRAARGEVDGIEPIRARIERLSRDGDRAVVHFVGGESVVVDRIVSNVGYRPDLDLTRELQVHLCYASEGPMKLAASLLASSGNVDCLAQESAGVDTLKNPETDFFVIGNKSYGRNSNFLLRVGFEQIAAILDDIT